MKTTAAALAAIATTMLTGFAVAAERTALVEYYTSTG